ncbi:hypothetical protein DFH11DRAFT_426628 [Phellopilus nigrolimitatus]|nr:hypothetical protein DFH11DRAFT_426628 [Phellopilus nigrolimitatus]
MSAEVTIALGVAVRVFVNVLCVQNPRLGAALVGVFDGFLIHRSWIANTLLEPLTLVTLAAGLLFDHYLFGGFERTVTLLLGCGLGVVLADFGPDVWYEIGGEQLSKDVSREMASMFSFVGDDDSASDRDDRSDVASVISNSTKVSASSRRTARSAATGTSLTARPSRPRARAQPQSTITRLSRVTFDESSISQSQASSDDDYTTDIYGAETEFGAETAGLTTEFALDGDAESESALPSASATGIDEMYMEPSTSTGSAGSAHTRVLSRLHIPMAGPSGVPRSALSNRSSSRTRLTTEDGETTPRATSHPVEFSPLPPSAIGPPPLAPLFPEPSYVHAYAPPVHQPVQVQAPTPPSFSPVHFSEPVYSPASYPEPNYSPVSFPEPDHSPASFPEPEHAPEPHEPSRLARIFNGPIVDPHNPEEDHPDSPESARLWVPPSNSKLRSRSPSPVGPRPPPSPKASPPSDVFGEEKYISESIDEHTVDVRDLDREPAIELIEEAWKGVEKKHHRRLNILVRHDDDELQSKKNSTFHLLEELENLRFNTKVRPGLIIITSRSRR